MKEYTYLLRAESIEDDAGDKHRVYGIEVWQGNEQVLVVKDIFADRSSAEALISLCNRLKLSVLHLLEVIEDNLP